MLTIALKPSLGIDENGGGELQVDPHPVNADSANRDDRKATTNPMVFVAFENVLAPVLVRIDGQQGNGVIESLNAWRGKLAGMNLPDVTLEDGLYLIDLLLPWALQHPKAYWDIAGTTHELNRLRERTVKEHAESVEGVDRFSETPLNVRGMHDVGAAEPMVETFTSKCDGETCKKPCCDAVKDDRDHQTHAKANGSSSSASGRKKEKPPTVADINARRARQLQEDGMGRPALVSGRVSTGAKLAIIEQNVSAGTMLEKVATALMTGMPFDEVAKVIDDAIARRLDEKRAVA